MGPRKMTSNRERRTEFLGTVTVSILEARLDSSGHYDSNSFAVTQPTPRFSSARFLQLGFRWRGQARNSRCHKHGDEEQKRAEKPRRAREVPAFCRINEKRKGKREQSRSENPGEADQATDRALQLALFRFTHAPRHHSLRGRGRDRPNHHHRNREEKKEGVRREARQDHPERAKKLSEVERPPFAQARDDRLHHPGGNHDGTGSH